MLDFDSRKLFCSSDFDLFSLSGYICSFWLFPSINRKNCSFIEKLGCS